MDDYIIAEMRGLKRVVNQFEKHDANPVLRADKPWEQRIGEYMLIHDERDSAFKCWYHGSKVYYDKPGRSEVGYAISNDGVRWEKPNLGLVEFEGTAETNIVPNVWRTVPLIVHEPGATDPRRRFRSLRRDPSDTEGYYHTMYSPDGIHWNTKDSERTNMKYVDDPPYIHFDAQRGLYTFYRRCWTRSHAEVGGGHQWGWPGKRAVGFALSRDFSYWQPNGAFILVPDEYDDRWAQENGGRYADLHAMRGFPYEGIWLGLVERENIVLPAPRGPDGRAVLNDDSYREHSLAYSRNGVTWHRLEDKTPPIPRGDRGEWDCADLGYPSTLPFIRGDEIWIYYRGVNCTKLCPSWLGEVPSNDERAKRFPEFYRAWKDTHQHPWDARTASIGIAKIRIDGFVSLDAGDEEAVLVTRPLQAEGRRLILNARIDGSLQVEIVGDFGAQNGIPEGPSDWLTGDSLRHVVRWSGTGDLGTLTGRRIRLRIGMRAAKLYSLRFADSV